jgi:hypothetical protein
MKISDLVNKVEDFEFDFDGIKLTGRYFKYKTTTPSYAKKMEDGLPEIPENGTEAEQITAIGARSKALKAAIHQGLADTIESWNAEDDDGNPVAPVAEIFASLPEPFTRALAERFKQLRDLSANPTSPDSPST